MICPFCGKEMKAGMIRFDGRSLMKWIGDDDTRSRSEKFWDALGGVGVITASTSDTWSCTGQIQANYCPACKKMIFETDITK